MTGRDTDDGKSVEPQTQDRSAPGKPAEAPLDGVEVVKATEPPTIKERRPDDLPDLGGRID